MAQASYGYFGVGVETTPGTAVAPTKFYPTKSVDFDKQVEFIDIREIRGSRQAFQKHDGPLTSSFTFDAAVYPMGALGVILKGLVGNVETTTPTGATAARKHTFIDANTLPSLTVERADSQTAGAGSLLAERLPGAKIESVSVTSNFGEDVQITVNGQALSFPDAPPARPASIDYPTCNPLIFTGVNLEIDGEVSPYFESFTYEITNTLERQNTLRNTREGYRMFEGGIEVTASGTLVFEDLILYNKFKNSEQLSLKWVAKSDKIEDSATTGDPAFYYEMGIEFPVVKVESYSLPMEAGGVIKADVSFAVSYDFATQKLFNLWLVNEEASGAYNS